MPDITIKQFADFLSTSSDQLIAQLNDAGMRFSNTDEIICDHDKHQLLEYLRISHREK